MSRAAILLIAFPMLLTCTTAPVEEGREEEAPAAAYPQPRPGPSGGQLAPTPPPGTEMGPPELPGPPRPAGPEEPRAPPAAPGEAEARKADVSPEPWTATRPKVAPGDADRPVPPHSPGADRWHPNLQGLDPADVLIESYVSRLTLWQKIGQHFIAWVPGAAVSERARKLIQEGGVAGVILTAENVRSREQLAELTHALQELAAGNSPPIGLLIGIDQEGGRVNRLRLEGVTQFPPPHYWAGHEDPQFIESAAYIINREILDLGCNLNFAPVLDLYAMPDQSVIGDRSMGDDSATVGRYGIAYLAGAQRAGVASVAKHFPGHGGTAVDSHLRLPVVETDAQALAGRDLVPFRMAVEQGLDAVMTAHVLYPRLDPQYPATLSRPIVQGLLREQLGFRGVVVSDGIGMRALQSHFSIEEILCRSIEAGVDLILGQSPYDILALEETVAALIRQGRIREAEIDEGVRRILLLKLKYGLLPPLAE